MLRVKLREVMEDYRRRTGEHITYGLLAERIGVSRATVESLASRGSYNTRLSTIEKLCRALDCQPGALLELTTEHDSGYDDNQS